MEVEEEVCDCGCAALPYATMPTLLELQQMKNRLMVAQAGKELMKWSSSSTGVELKKISAELQEVYTNFGRDMRQAYLLLARCRYFNQEFYRNIIEGVKTASVRVKTAINTVAGVEMVHFTPLEIPNKKVCKCPFLCRGGQAIQEAKKIWSILLRSHIKMAELRTNFQAVESTHRHSTKRLNIINQIILPKTHATINYILVQLEETTREESHRIRVKTSKLRNGSNISYCCCGSNFTYFKPVSGKRYAESKKVSTGSILSSYDIMLPGVSLYEIYSEPMTARKGKSTSKDISQVIDIYEPIAERESEHTINSLVNFYEYISKETQPYNEIPKQRMSLGDFDPGIDQPKVNRATYAMDGLLEACKITRHRLSVFANNEKPCQVNSNLSLSLGHLKSHVDVVIQASSRLQSSVHIASKSVKNFIKSCESLDQNLKYTIKDINTAPLNRRSKKRIQHLIKSIDDVVKIIKNYRSQGLVTPSFEEFSKVCAETKAKIGFYNIRHDLQKIDYLKSYVTNLESITTDITREGVKTPSIQKFLSTCKDFREKLEEHKRRKKKPICENKILQSVKQKRQAETDHFLSESVQHFISSCEDIIKRFQRHQSATKLIDSLYNNNIVQIAKLMTNLQNQGLLSKSTIAFLTAKTRGYKLDESTDENNDGDLCSCQSDTFERFESYNMTDLNRNAQIESKLEENTTTDEEKEFRFGVRTKIAATSLKSEKVNHHKSKVKGNKASSLHSEYSEKRFEVTHAPSKTEGEDDLQSCTCSFDISEISEVTTIPSDTSCLNSDMLLEEINTYDSCPVSKPKESASWVTKSSDSWTKPLLPKAQYCVMCASQISSESSEKQVCETCEKIHGKEEIVRAIAKTYTM